MASCSTPQFGNSYCPQVTLTVTVDSSTATSVTYAWTLKWVTYGYYVSGGANREVTATIAGDTVCSTYINMNGQSSFTIATGKKTVSKSSSSKKITISCSCDFRITWNGTYGGSKSGSSTITVPAISAYTVTFNLNGGTRTGGGALTQTVASGGSATAPTCTKTGYTFKGWNKALTNITANTTITAQWTANTYKVTYDLNGGSGSFSSFTKTYGVDKTLPTTVPTKVFTVTFDPNGGACSTKSLPAAATFSYWKSSTSGKTYKAGATFSENAATTLTAYYVLGSVGTLPTPTRSGYQFNGWLLNVDKIYLTSTTKIEADTTAVAQWSSVYKITFDPNGGTAGKTASIQYTSGVGNTIPANSSLISKNKTITISFEGNGGSVSVKTKTSTCTLLSWNTKKDGSGTTYQPGSKVDGSANITLYAIWSTIKFADIKPSDPTFSGATFSHWNTSSDNSGTKITDSTIFDSDRTLYAIWGTFQVKLHGNGGLIVLDNSDEDPAETIILQKSLGIDLTIPNYTSYYNEGDEDATTSRSFVGWATSRTATAAQYTKGSKFKVDAPTTLYAVYAIPTYTVKWSKGYGSSPIMKTEEVAYGKSATPPADPVREGYTFGGWLGEYKSVKSDRTIVALWGNTPIWIYNGTTWIGYEPEEVK